MMLKQWEQLPDYMKNSEVRPYWEALNRKKGQLAIKRGFDLCMALLLLILLAIPMVIISILIKIDSKGPVFYRQERITINGKHFKIHKFRTMVADAERQGTAVTVHNDERVTKIGKKLRRFRLDELPQIWDVIMGDMSFVGTRPEAVKYVEAYRPEYYATLLMPAGITSEATIRYKDEEKLMDSAKNADEVYLNEILPQKMKWNLKSLQDFQIGNELLTMIRTILAVFGRNYN